MAVRRGRKAPPPGVVLKQVQQQLTSGWPQGLTVLAGDAAYHLDSALEGIVGQIRPDDAESDFSMSVFGDERVDVAKVVAAARSVGMFAPRRVVLVRDAAILEGEADAVVEYGGSPPAGSYLIVRAYSLDLRRKLHKALASAGKFYRFEASGDVDPREAVAEVSAMAREQGLELKQEAVTLLAQMHGADLYRVAGELEKLRAWSGDARSPIGAETVREVASGGAAVSGWEVANAVMARDRESALAAARHLVDAGDEPIRIVGGLAWRARMMMQARMDREACYSRNELLAFPAVLLRADRALKSRRISPRAVLEDLVDSLTRVPGGAALHRKTR
jgi:DNA polymerase-3 subunit delta